MEGKLNADRIASIVNRLEYLSSHVDVLTASLSPEAMREFVSYRREIAELIFELSGIVNQCVAGLPNDVRASTDLETRAAQSRLRSALMNLQANWPLPRIFDEVERYRLDKSAFNHEQEAYIVHVRTRLLPTLRRHGNK